MYVLMIVCLIVVVLMEISFILSKLTTDASTNTLNIVHNFQCYMSSNIQRKKIVTVTAYIH